MFPIRDTIPSRHLPVMTWTLIALNVVVFVFQLALPPQAEQQLFYLYGVVPARLTVPGWADSVGLPSGGYFSFLTSMFLHGGFFHLLVNMWTLWIFGDNVEDRMGATRFLLFYLLAGMFAALAQVLAGPDSTLPMVGASGAIAGILGAYLVLYPHSRVVTLVPILFLPLFFEVPAFVYLIFWFLTQLLSGAWSLTGPGDSIAWWAHIGGFVAGLLLYRYFVSRRPPPPAPARHIVLPDYPRRYRR